MERTKLLGRFYYVLSLLIVVVCSFYPIMMGIQILTAYIRDGKIEATDYPKYVIPYTPISIAIILSLLLMPIILKVFKKVCITCYICFWHRTVFVV